MPDTTQETQQEKEVRQAFEGYEQRKYKEWKTIQQTNPQNRTPEQKAFDEYILSRASTEFTKHLMVKNAQTEQQVKTWSKSTGTSLSNSYFQDFYGGLQANDLVLIYGTFSDAEKSGKPWILFAKIKSSDGSSLTFEGMGMSSPFVEGGATPASKTNIYMNRRRGNSSLGKYEISKQLTSGGLQFNFADMQENAKRGNLQVGDYAFIRVKTNDDYYVYLFGPLITVTETVFKFAGGNKTIMIDMLGKEGAGGSADITASAEATSVESSQSATANVAKEGNNLKFTFQIPKGERGPVGPAGPSGGGGGSMANIQLPHAGQNSPESISATGGYCMNLIDYRELSRKNKFGVNGIEIYSHGLKDLEDGNTHKTYAGPFTGIKKLKEIKFESVSTEKVNHPEFKTRFSLEIAGRDGINVTSVDLLESPNVSTKTNTPNEVGKYYIGVGGSPSPQKGRMKVRAYYTSDSQLHPTGLTRDFEFKNYKGHILRGNGTDNDTYHTGINFNSITRKVGVCNLRDLKLWRIDQMIGVDDPEHENFFYFEVPKDCAIPEAGSDAGETNSKLIGGKCITNNLSEIPESDPHLDSEQHVPYFISKIFIWDNTLGTVPNLPKEKKYCFMIALNHLDSYKWKDVLAKTQIIYPLDSKYTTKTQIPEGGYCVHLTDGTTIYSHNYNQIEISDATKDGSYTFKGSQNGYPNIKVQISQIVSITPVE